MLQLASHVLVETEKFGSNNGIIQTSEGLVLVDAPYRPTDALLWRTFADSLGPTRYLVNTDHHADHTVGNVFLGGEIISHHLSRERLLSAPRPQSFIDEVMATIDPAGRHLLANYVPRVASITFDSCLSLDIGGINIDLMHAPGHAPGGVCVYLASEGVLFTGDLVCESSLPGFSDADIPSWLAALSKIEKMDVSHVVPGHGRVAGLPEVRRFRQKIEELIAEIEWRIDLGQSREEIADVVVYEDRIHGPNGGSAGYPPEVARETIRRSVRVVHDNVIRMRQTAT